MQGYIIFPHKQLQFWNSYLYILMNFVKNSKMNGCTEIIILTLCFPFDMLRIKEYNTLKIFNTTLWPSLQYYSSILLFIWYSVKPLLTFFSSDPSVFDGVLSKYEELISNKMIKHCGAKLKCFFETKKEIWIFLVKSNPIELKP